MLGLFVREDPNLRRNYEAQKLREQQRGIPLPEIPEPEPFVEQVFYRRVSQNRFRARM